MNTNHARKRLVLVSDQVQIGNRRRIVIDVRHCVQRRRDNKIIPLVFNPKILPRLGDREMAHWRRKLDHDLVEFRSGNIDAFLDEKARQRVDHRFRQGFVIGFLGVEADRAVMTNAELALLISRSTSAKVACFHASAS